MRGSSFVILAPTDGNGVGKLAGQGVPTLLPKIL